MTLGSGESDQKVETSVEYISTGVNRSPHCMTWSHQSGLVYYGAHNAVAVYNPNTFKIVKTLVGHEACVNCVRCVASDKKDIEYLVSASTDKSVILWKSDTSRGILYPRVSQICVIKSHTGPVTNVAAKIVEDKMYVASTSNDNTVKVNFVQLTNEGEGTSTQETGCVQLGTGLALELHLVTLPGTSQPLLLVARDNTKIEMYHGEVWEKVGVMDGHEDWVRCMDSKVEDGSVMVASGGQDSLVRLWRLHRSDQNLNNEEDELVVKEEVFNVEGEEWSVGVNSVLSGHEGWVYNVQWSGQGDQLLTASMDKTMMIWEEQEGVWLEKVRVGEVGGNTLGFLGAQWGGASILGYSWGGAFHLWSDKGEGEWGPGVVVGGHQQQVVDLSWEPHGRWLLTVSRDQSARIHVVWQKEDVWLQVGRPQVHGYDMSCCAMLPGNKYVSGAEEKVLRAFTAPSNFLENLSLITGQKMEYGGSLAVAQGASTPSLGLSNKAVFQGEQETPVQEKHVKDNFPDHYFTAETYNVPPPEETLVQNTLWPEEHKLYGHGYELFSVAASPCGRLVASSCKSTDAESSKVILWDTKTWSQVAAVPGHSLTVTQLSFSPDSSKLLCVSRDRTWTLHSIDTCMEEKIKVSTSLISKSEKKGSVITRVIWACAWTHDSKFFLTASRDKKLVVWAQDDKGWRQAGKVMMLPDSVTAVAASSQLQDDKYVIAAGLDNGSIHILSWQPELGWSPLSELDKNANGHHSTVTRLQFKPMDKISDKLILASCSLDTSVRIIHVKL